jgi:hypothetical protein
LWTDLSSTARELHQDWETPDLWPRILQGLDAEPKPRAPWWKDWRFSLALAAGLIVAAAVPLYLQHRQPKAPIVAKAKNPDFLTEQALLEVEKNEAAYRKSIEHLSQLAEPKLEDSSSAVAVNAQEKLLMLDAAIADTRSNVATNRFNLHLQTTLAELYREKQQTLKELLTSDQSN